MPSWFKRSAAAALFAALCATPALAQPTILREGEGAHRRTLDALELKPFSIGSLDALTDWTNGSAPTSGALDGKVVLILFWNDWYPQAAKSINVAKRMAEKHKGELIVIAAHHKDGWAEAKKPKTEAEGATFLLAHDSKNALRAALKQDADPDFYLVDRAGQLRFADIQTESIEAAVDFLVSEAKDKAAGLNAEIAAKNKQDELDRKRSEAIRSKVDMTDIPEVPFQMPLPEAYDKKKVKWPYMPRPDGHQPEDPKNPDPPVIVSLPDAGFFPKKPTMKGRAILLYFWHPDLPGTYNLFEPMNLVQRQYPRDLVVIGVMSPLTIESGGSGGNKEYKLDADPKALKEKIERIQERQKLNHTMVLDTEGAIFNIVKTKDNAIYLPWGAVVSSDNTLRYAGFMNSSLFRGALDRVLSADPGIKARREAEDEYLKSRSKE
ncbi:MAG TPA: hypothetical protein VD997_17110 [Phycisphaerales bacterium]|nr:hypothetical protein [Phycisphaerales bacterium]